MKLILAPLAMLAVLFAFAEAGKCPSSHPYPYLYGSYCCLTAQTCHGKNIGFELKCCKDNNFVACPSGICQNTYGQQENKCPASHPYPYLYGSYCCHHATDCHHKAIGFSSKCCKDNNFKNCPSGVCKNTYGAGECPATHPYPYLSGASCCKVETTCHHTPLVYGSKCCQNNNYIFCPRAPCKRRDPCLKHNGGCSHICKSEGSAVTCSCKAGYKLKSDGKTCVIIDPCKTHNGGCSQICKSEGSAVLCSCKAGFKLQRDGKTCVRVDPCKKHNGGCSQICSSEGSAVLCSCKHGFKLKSDRKTCVRIDPCKTHNGGCDHFCKSHGQSVTCSCKSGYTLQADGKTCHRIDPCTIKNGGCSQVCHSSGHAVTCSCKKGFKLNKDGKSCDKECKGVADIGFVIDSSGSLAEFYQDEKNFLKSLAKSFGISRHGSHAGVVAFSSETELSIKFNQHYTQASFDRAVDNIHLLNGFTRIDLGLKQAKNELFAVKNGARTHVPRLCVLITDGSQTQAYGAEDPSTIAGEIRAMGIKTIVVGVGKGVKKAELDRIAGNPHDSYTAADFHELTSSAFANKVKSAMCKGKN